MNRRVSQDDDVTRIFATRFVELLRERGMTQQDASYALRLSPAVINRYVKEKHAPSAATIVLIARHFSVSADWLLGLADERRPAPPRARTADEIVAMTDELVANPPRRRASENPRRP